MTVSTVTIVCLGASNTEGYGVAPSESYPSRLAVLLTARGIQARVLNAGISGDTTSGMLARLDDEVPEGTKLVVFQPGINDLHDLPRREANIAEIQRRLTERGITIVPLDNTVIRSLPREVQAWDGIHLTAKGYAMLAEAMLPKILAGLGR